MSLLDYIDEKRRQKVREIRTEIRLKQLEDSLKTVSTVAAGALAGLAVGVLFAPKSGKETRKEIADYAKDKTDMLANELENAKENIALKTQEFGDDVKDKYDEIRNKGYTELEKAAGEVSNKAQDFADKTAEKVEETGEKVADKAVEVGEKIEEGSKDLKKDTKKAGDKVSDAANKVKNEANKNK
ncbi:YtxH domain-containing protein [Lagierella sp.]|uniref:YtxH domain-containing protein n=1 Tax=Lagierella sp. TaxID=2849657 RepID=UPI002633FE82|nr:YtxH domain-containing protein [Lagierella sp.]